MPRTYVHFVENTFISWNACVPMVVSITGAASAAISVRPRCGQVATGSTQEMVSRSLRSPKGLWARPCLKPRNLKVEGNWSAGHEVETGSRWLFNTLSLDLLGLFQNPKCGVLWRLVEIHLQIQSPVTSTFPNKLSLQSLGCQHMMSLPAFYPSQDISTASSTCPSQSTKRMAVTEALRVR